MYTEKVKEYLIHHLSLVKGRHVQSLIDYKVGIQLVISHWVESPSWNHAVIYKNDLLSEEIIQIEKTFELIGRRPAFYIVDQLQRETAHHFGALGYQLFDTEFWMGFDVKNEKPFSDSKVDLFQVLNDEGIHSFLQGFELGFSSLEVGYLRQLYLSLINNSEFQTKGIHYFATMDGLPVGVASCYFDNSVAGIYNLAVSQPYQGMGIGKKIIAGLISEAKKHGCKYFFLQADYKSRNFYAKLGFEPLFEGNIHVKMI
ncbi:MAG: GNAT family N-acetyltransferase [Lentimicrobium sp.]|jgi:N-acetylglutamate synthase-like GNAT family acetyltransferase|nr:GNAT family N-acetyltransferase [Lentimicrobium sp.]